MKKRIDALSRIGKFQSLMRDLGRLRLHSLEREQATLGDELKAALEALQSDALAYGPTAGLAGRHIRALSRKRDQAARDQEAARLSALAQEMRAKLAERAIDSTTRRHDRLRERKELAELIERALAHRGASPT